MSRVFIGLGSNEGNRLQAISRAIRLLSALPGTRLVQMATIRETEPVGGPPQGPYLNTAVELDTVIAPRQLLDALHDIERRLGRQHSTQRWGPRSIDLDLLFYNEQIIKESGLCVPHPRLHERVFVLEPLVQLDSHLIHPVLQRSVAALFEQLLTTSPA